jgi:hypothetical protein
MKENNMVIKRVSPLSLAKVSGVLYAGMGLIFGAIISVVSLVGGAFMPRGAGFGSGLFGVAAVVALPIFYGGIGFIFSLIAAVLYNLVASWVGGVEIEVQ